MRFLEAVSSFKARAALTTAYAAGLRASEAAGIKVADIDSSRMVVRVEQGKGGRDRLRHALAAAAGHSTVILAAGAAHALAVPRP